MSIVSIRIYRAVSSTIPRSPNDQVLAPDSLLATLTIPSESGKPLNKERAKKIVALAITREGKPWLMWRHPNGWLTSVEYDGGKAWALVSDFAGAYEKCILSRYSLLTPKPLRGEG